MYNFKIIEYPNGTVQLRSYTIPILSRTNEDKTDNENILFEPFEGKQVKEVDSFSHESNCNTKKQENLRKSLARTKQKVHTYSRCCKWEWFVTLTYSPTLIDRTDFKECMKRVRYYLHNARREAPSLRYLFLPELHSDMVSWHCHGLLSETGNLKFEKSGHFDDSGNPVYNLQNWKWGFSTATKISDPYRISNYVIKYITKESMLLAQNAHRYYVSNNLPKPKESLMLVDPIELEDVIQTLADSMGKDIVYCSKPYSTPFTDVTFMELQ